MLYIRKLEIVDETDNVILRLKRKNAVEGLTSALDVVRQKDNINSFKEIFKNYLKKIDEEFKEYFNIGGKNEKKKS